MSDLQKNTNVDSTESDSPSLLSGKKKYILIAIVGLLILIVGCLLLWKTTEKKNADRAKCEEEEKKKLESEDTKSGMNGRRYPGRQINYTTVNTSGFTAGSVGSAGIKRTPISSGPSNKCPPSGLVLGGSIISFAMIFGGIGLAIYGYGSYNADNPNSIFGRKQSIGTGSYSGSNFMFLPLAF